MNREKTPRQSGKPGSAQPRAPISNSAFRIPPAVPPRAQSPVPALKPAKRSLSPARNSRSRKAEKRIAASARNTAPPIERPSPHALPPAHPPCQASDFRPPRAQTPVPALKPAKRSLSPAHNSPRHDNRHGSAASAQNTAPPIERPSPRAHSRQRILHVRRAISAPRAQTLLPVCIRRAQTPRRRAIHDHARQKNASPRQRGKSARNEKAPSGQTLERG